MGDHQSFQYEWRTGNLDPWSILAKCLLFLRSDHQNDAPGPASMFAGPATGAWSHWSRATLLMDLVESCPQGEGSTVKASRPPDDRPMRASELLSGRRHASVCSSARAARRSDSQRQPQLPWLPDEENW